ncbi:hypothetical protein B9Z19DRAFT_961817, partial [Tuber borchii]
PPYPLRTNTTTSPQSPAKKKKLGKPSTTPYCMYVIPRIQYKRATPLLHPSVFATNQPRTNQRPHTPPSCPPIPEKNS